MPEKIAMTPPHPEIDQVFWDVVEVDGSTLYLPPGGQCDLERFISQGSDFEALPSVDRQRPELERQEPDNPFNKPRVRDLGGLALRFQEYCGTGHVRVSGLAWVRANLIARASVNHYLPLLGRKNPGYEINFPDYEGIIFEGLRSYQAMSMVPPEYTNMLNGSHGFAEYSLKAVSALTECVGLFFEEVRVEDGVYLLDLDTCDCNILFSPDKSKCFMIDVSTIDRGIVHAEMLNEIVEG